MVQSRGFFALMILNGHNAITYRVKNLHHYRFGPYRRLSKVQKMQLDVDVSPPAFS